MASGLRYGPLGPNCIHLCIDMQRMFGPGLPWAVPWMDAVLPNIEALTRHHADRTIFTRFIPPKRLEDAHGTWRRYYERWSEMTRQSLAPEYLRIVPELERFSPPARVIDKTVYSPWTEGHLDGMLASTGVDTLVISGGETDVCVLGAVIGAVDRGYRVILAQDAICGSADATHDALMFLFRSRFSEQIEMAAVEELLWVWR
ncbi:cysteine hydrolase family protein [Falsirhodobacter halotolerans]|uniref:cysteine hydrolase family protein n=1 Tax=Falsirhodobacter halotolerans TaxID=1146892 RepID=UPI001FD0FD2E|nr:isochorismatase family cysteine hydrolase [Falsirhodobacter halotolerans]MCJ8139970.1 cysteine hydrolase [Falsirhodobacter halotolerans]